ncbi:uncharacterized protein LOC124273535 [Haliotis rubra]|uniref:uncharacterized protein LOC124273535 n=1 Tax=Haliotis rubra TaxID=36100 RepID=UPI001EE53EEB|nr:uncharacterized protein LOC124273535 [Haliotis rubra]XP_046564781.1 uncharacterized protein LOC124273535 [Haliotis rubra]
MGMNKATIILSIALCWNVIVFGATVPHLPGTMLGATGQSVFDFDKNEDGVVDGMELYSVLTYLDGRLGYTPREARVILSIADINGDNQLDISELLQLTLLVETESLQHK